MTLSGKFTTFDSLALTRETLGYINTCKATYSWAQRFYIERRKA